MATLTLKPLPQNARKKLEKEKQTKKLLKEQFLTEELTTHPQAIASENLVDDLGIEVNPSQNFRQQLQTQKSNTQKNVSPVTPQNTKTASKQAPALQAPVTNPRVDIRQQPIAVQINVQNRQNQLNPFARQPTPQIQKQNNEKAQEKKEQAPQPKIYQPQINPALQAIKNLTMPAPMPAKPQSSTSTFEADGKLYSQKRVFS
jgi:hypothetical protein